MSLGLEHRHSQLLQSYCGKHQTDGHETLIDCKHEFIEVANKLVLDGETNTIDTRPVCVPLSIKRCNHPSPLSVATHWPRESWKGLLDQ